MMGFSRWVLSDRPIVSRHHCTDLLLFVCLSPSSSPPSSPARLWLRSQGQSEVAPPPPTTTQFTSLVEVFDPTSATLPQLAYAAEKSCEGDGRRESEETRRRAQSNELSLDADLLTAMLTPDSSLTHTDIMQPLICYRRLPFPLLQLWSLQCQQSINRGIHHSLHHHSHPRQHHHMTAGPCFPPRLSSSIAQKMMLI